ncbi:MAG: 2Fe-2S iron-sulfur cluster-binding protein, partial [Pseudomonadota bacterium]
MTQVNRLPCGLVDRNATLTFNFDGREMRGHPGDTLASALLANGVRLMGRSFKYHRPRGVFTAGSDEPNALVALRGGGRQEPNTRATTAELYQGLLARSLNRVGSLSFDLMAVNDLLADLLCFFPIWSSLVHYRNKHLNHHLYPNDPDHDPNLAGDKAEELFGRFPMPKPAFIYQYYLKFFWPPFVFRNLLDLL